LVAWGVMKNTPVPRKSYSKVTHILHKNKNCNRIILSNHSVLAVCFKREKKATHIGINVIIC
jgi:hypothetical protein